jgi:hypothetical protein
VCLPRTPLRPCNGVDTQVTPYQAQAVW